MTIHDLNPQRVWKNFYALTQIPRPSKHEKAVAAYLVKFGKDLGLETIQDETGNVIIRKPATKGMESRKGIILQAHMDMVPQKNNDKVHDFTKDPITTKVVEKEDGPWLYADGTTLGADDGLGVAAAMAVLEAGDLVHGPVEALFTVDEETGMTGAFGLGKGIGAKALKGDILINLDSETEGELYVGCAGSMDATATFKYKEEPMPKGWKAMLVKVGGLRGGHSGMEINEGRGNANKVLARTILPMLRDMDCKLCSIAGGNMRNAIPREACAVIAVPKDAVDDVKTVIAEAQATALKEYSRIDPGVSITIEETKSKTFMSGNVGLKAVKAIYACPSGVGRMSLEIKDLVESSNNLAIIDTKGGRIIVNCMLRSSVDSTKFDLAEQMRSIFELAGAKVAFEGGYSGWSPNMDSPILKTMVAKYKSLFGYEPSVTAIHAGLECGILGMTYHDWDMISCGPTLKSPHSPEERCFIPSVEKWWNFIVAVIADAPKK